MFLDISEALTLVWEGCSEYIAVVAVQALVVTIHRVCEMSPMTH